MTLSLRNNLIKLMLIISISLFLSYIVSFYYLNQDNFFSLKKIIALISEQNNRTEEAVSKNLHWSLFTAAILFFFSIISSLLLFHYFKKKISPEIFFFVLFLMSFSLQSIRLFQFQLLMMGVSPFFGVIITRVYYFFKFFSVFCFFASSLFPVGIKFQKFGTILISILLISFTISALMPIDSTNMNQYFLYVIGDTTSIFLMVLSIRFLTLINFIRATISTKSKNYVMVLISSTMIITGDELFLLLPIPLLAFFMILAGTIIYSRSIYNYYLWI